MSILLSFPIIWLVATPIVILIACCILFLIKFRSKNESSDPSVEPELLQETNDELLPETSENLSATRRKEMLEKIKEERIKEYLYQKKRKFT